MINYKELISQDFKTEKKFSLSAYLNKDMWIMLKKIPYHIRQKILSFKGLEVERQTDKKGTEKVITKKTDEYYEFINEQWRMLIEYGIDKNKHNFIDNETQQPEVLTVEDFAEFGKYCPEMIDDLLIEIYKFNGLFFDGESEKKQENGKKNSGPSIFV